MNKKHSKPSARSAAASLSENAAPALTELLRRLGPPEEVQRHFRAARIEVLKGLRALLDARLEHLSHPARGPRKGEKIQVE